MRSALMGKEKSFPMSLFLVLNTELKCSIHWPELCTPAAPDQLESPVLPFIHNWFTAELLSKMQTFCYNAALLLMCKHLGLTPGVFILGFWKWPLTRRAGFAPPSWDQSLTDYILLNGRTLLELKCILRHAKKIYVSTKLLLTGFWWCYIIVLSDFSRFQHTDVFDWLYNMCAFAIQFFEVWLNFCTGNTDNVMSCVAA